MSIKFKSLEDSNDLQLQLKVSRLELRDSSFKYFRTVRIEKQIRPLVFGRSYGSTILFRDLLTFTYLGE
jgi:hypothetical protein